jgi:hypothetical protein
LVPGSIRRAIAILKFDFCTRGRRCCQLLSIQLAGSPGPPLEMIKCDLLHEDRASVDGRAEARMKKEQER